jgi:hypothetical protein
MLFSGPEGEQLDVVNIRDSKNFVLAFVTVLEPLLPPKATSPAGYDARLTRKRRTLAVDSRSRTPKSDILYGINKGSNDVKIFNFYLEDLELFLQYRKFLAI